MAFNLTNDGPADSRSHSTLDCLLLADLWSADLQSADVQLADVQSGGLALFHSCVSLQSCISGVT